VADHPLPMRNFEVQALLREIAQPATGKTQHRHILRPMASIPGAMRWIPELEAGVSFAEPEWWTAEIAPHTYTGRARVRCVVGDRLWVRETVRLPANAIKYGPVYYEADKRFFMNQTFPLGKATPSIHMPRWASRLTLVVTDVRVQRLQDISDEDVEQEGATRGLCEWDCARPVGLDGYPLCNCGDRSHQETFARLWNSIHGPDAWDANPWVVALTFDVHRCNIDQMEAAHVAA
jgi:hypothetical protein